MTNLRLWAGCERKSWTVLKQVGRGENTWEVGRGDPLVLDTVGCTFFWFQCPMWEGRALALEPAAEVGGPRWCRLWDAKIHMPTIGFQFNPLTYTSNPGPHAHAQFPFTCGRAGIYFQLVTSEDRFFRKCNCLKGRGSAFTSAEVPLAPQAGVSSPYPAARFRPRQPRWSGGQKSAILRWVVSLNFPAALSAEFSVRCQRVLNEWIMALKAPCSESGRESWTASAPPSEPSSWLSLRLALSPG